MSEQPSEQQSKDVWQPSLYDQKHSFVWKLAASLIELLELAPGQTVLDLGCGTGQLTAQIADAGARVIGMDSSAKMIAEAQRLYPQLDFRLGNAQDFALTPQVDSVFSNATLHWIQDPQAVVECLAQAIRSDGRLVVEFGGQGNVRHVVDSAKAASETVLGEAIAHPWYFPSIGEFASLLESVGFQVAQAALFDRPTTLEGEDGLRDWLRMFGGAWLERIPPEQHDQFFEQVERLAKPHLYRDDAWFVDYRRLRLVAIKQST